MLDIPEWTVSLYDLNNQEIMDISKLVNLNLNLKLNENSTLAFAIDLVQFENLCASVNIHPREVLYPSRTEVKVSRNGNLIFGGIIATADAYFGEIESTIQATADSYIQYFAKRLLSKTYSSTDRSDIAWDAIETVQSVPNGSLGVTRGVSTPTYDSDLTADYMDVKSIIQRYTYAVPTVYDYEITPGKVFNTYLRLGSDKPEVELVYPQNIIGIKVPRSSDTLYNKVIGLGSGIGEERIETTQEDVPSQEVYRVLETKKTYNSVVRIDTLIENTRGFLAQSTGVLVLPEITVANDSIDLDTLRVGDSVMVSIINSSFCDDVNGMFRIYEMKIQVDENSFETVSLSFYRPDAGGELTV